MSLPDQETTTRIGMISGGIGLAVLVLMMVFGSGFFAALVVGLVIAGAVAVALFLKAQKDAHAAPAAPAEPAPGPKAKPAQAPEPEPVSEPAVTAEPSAPVAAPAPAEDGAGPARLDAPREGGADDLKKLKGVGPKLETVLHGMGFYHFDQIANWTETELAWVDENLEGFRGRASRDDWVAQAKELSGNGGA